MSIRWERRRPVFGAGAYVVWAWDDSGTYASGRTECWLNKDIV
jgi:hypothetical protein